MSRHISDDLIIEIFERLPTKSLVRFRCLSKLWYSRIASPDFIRRHRLRYSQQKVLIRQLNTQMGGGFIDAFTLHSGDEFLLRRSLGYFDTSARKFPCPFSKVANSCNGIFCLFDDHESRVTLWNPSNRRILTLPGHSSSSDGRELVFGFGFDPITDDYKIVRICYFSDYGRRTIRNSNVYSMKTHAWSSIAFPPKFDRMDFEACLVNGLLHWKAELYSPESYSWEYYIMSFNMSTHAFGKIKLPKPSWITRKVTIIDGCLGVVSFQNRHYCWIWVMKEYNNVASWYAHLKLSCEPGEIISVMQLPTNGYFLINNESRGLEVYNPVTKVRFVLSGTQDNKIYMETCLESLELLDNGEPES